jgi:hypothetical protein
MLHQCAIEILSVDIAKSSNSGRESIVKNFDLNITLHQLRKMSIDI